MADKHPKVAIFGSKVRGIPLDGWVKVGRRYLPTHIGNACVLRPVNQESAVIKLNEEEADRQLGQMLFGKEGYGYGGDEVPTASPTAVSPARGRQLIRPETSAPGAEPLLPVGFGACYEVVFDRVAIRSAPSLTATTVEVKKILGAVLEKVSQTSLLQREISLHALEPTQLLAYYINTDREEERRKHMEAQGRSAKLPLLRFKAIDRERINTGEFDDKYIKKQNLSSELRDPTRHNDHVANATVACYVSHSELLESLLRQLQPHQIGLVLEDDVEIPHNWEELIQTSLSCAPSDWALLKVSGWGYNRASDRQLNAGEDAANSTSMGLMSWLQSQGGWMSRILYGAPARKGTIKKNITQSHKLIQTATETFAAQGSAEFVELLEKSFKDAPPEDPANEEGTEGSCPDAYLMRKPFKETFWWHFWGPAFHYAGTGAYLVKAASIPAILTHLRAQPIADIDGMLLSKGDLRAYELWPHIFPLDYDHMKSTMKETSTKSAGLLDSLSDLLPGDGEGQNSSRGETVELFGWDASRAWRRCPADATGTTAGWVMLDHADFGPLVRPKGAKLSALPLEPLCCAAEEDQLPELRRFLSEGQNPCACDASGASALELAVRSDARDCAVYLIEAGAVTSPDQSQVALESAASSGTRSLVEALLGHTVSDNEALQAALAELTADARIAADRILELLETDAEANQKAKENEERLKEENEKEEREREEPALSQAEPTGETTEPRIPPAEQPKEWKHRRKGGELHEVVHKAVAIRYMPSTTADMVGTRICGQFVELFESSADKKWRKMEDPETGEEGWMLLHHGQIGALVRPVTEDRLE
ncbi:Uncharacterized protein SCF082_LOCUS30833 [Durusdinium trenchii]